MTCYIKVILFAAFVTVLQAEDDLKDFEFNSDEVMIAQESRQYQTVANPPVIIVKPTGVTNSHRPQYNLDSYEHESEFFEPTSQRTLVKNYKSSSKIRAKDGIAKDSVRKALERKDHVGKFAQILPIIRAMSGSQRVALASLVANQVGTPPGRTPMNLAQVRSMFGNSANTSTDLMLPILLDTANLIRRAVRSGKEPRDVKQTFLQPQAQLLRRSFTGDDDITLEDEAFDTGVETTTKPLNSPKLRTRRIIPPRTLTNARNSTVTDKLEHNRTDTSKNNDNSTDTYKITANITSTRLSTPTTTESVTSSSSSSVVRKSLSTSRSLLLNSSLDLIADSTNQTLAQDLPVAEKLRALNRYIDRKGALIRRGTYPPKPSSAPRRTTAEPSLPPIKRRPMPARKLPSSSPSEATKCELFTNTLCLHSEDYPTEAIVQSIRRNKAAAGALLADFKDPGDGALDGITAAQEANYTADHYLVSNRRGDTANRDFASAGEAGFMCPSTVKYARPQRARATSGQWKYIVNTGEHTQTLRLEKCLKPKDSCTYLTDNFKSKCVQVYNYHRLLTWDQQNGLHMDIFKVPTCCSCHIEGYSVSFPPLGHRVHETSSEHFPGEDLSSEQENNAFESVQPSVQRPSIKSPPFTHKKPLGSFPPFSDNQNLIAGQTFNKINDNDEGNLPPSNPMNSYGNSYFPDSFNQASSIKNVRRPPSARNPMSNNFDSVTLPSYLEPPIPAATSSFSFVNDSPSKYKTSANQFKRGSIRPNRPPIRKKISGRPDDLSSSGTSAVESFTSSIVDSTEEFNDYLEEPDIGATSVINSPKIRATIAPKLHAATTEKISTTLKTQVSSTVKDNFSSNGKRVNYNYHPIIDFFGEGKTEDESIDREDSEVSYVAPLNSEWKPINHPPSRNIETSNLVKRKIISS